MKYFYRMLAAIICVALISAGIYQRFISINFGIGLVEGSIAFFICQSIDNIKYGAVVFYGTLAIQVFVMRSIWAAIGFFVSPLLAFGVYLLIFLFAQYESKSKSGK